MTFEQALAAALKANKGMNHTSCEAWLITTLEGLGLFPLDRPQPPTLWELLRNYGVDIALAQKICNQAMRGGVKLPVSGQDPQE